MFVPGFHYDSIGFRQALKQGRRDCFETTSRASAANEHASTMEATKSCPEHPSIRIPHPSHQSCGFPMDRLGRRRRRPGPQAAAATAAAAAGAGHRARQAAPRGAPYPTARVLGQGWHGIGVLFGLFWYDGDSWFIWWTPMPKTRVGSRMVRPEPWMNERSTCSHFDEETRKGAMILFNCINAFSSHSECSRAVFACAFLPATRQIKSVARFPPKVKVACSPTHACALTINAVTAKMLNRLRGAICLG